MVLAGKLLNGLQSCEQMIVLLKQQTVDTENLWMVLVLALSRINNKLYFTHYSGMHNYYWSS